MSDVKFVAYNSATAKLIRKVVKRAKAGGLVSGADETLDLTMDLSATHANGCPIDWARLLEADDFNFAHDVRGIQSHIDRNTGQLTRSFLPRFAEKQAA